MDLKDIFSLSLDELIYMALDKNIKITRRDTKRTIINKILKRKEKLIEMSDVLQYNMIQFLKPEELVKLCEINKVFEKICKNNITWEMFIERDYGIKHKGKNPRIQYENLRIKDLLKGAKFLDNTSKYWLIFYIASYGLFSNTDDIYYFGSHNLTNREELYLARINKLIISEYFALDLNLLENIWKDLYDNLVSSVIDIPIEKNKKMYYHTVRESLTILEKGYIEWLDKVEELTLGDYIISVTLFKGETLYNNIINNSKYRNTYIKNMTKMPPIKNVINTIFNPFNIMYETKMYDNDIIIRNL